MLGLTLSRATPRLYRFETSGVRKERSLPDGMANRPFRPEARVPELDPLRAECARKLP
jgi:hypothetical protein